MLRLYWQVVFRPYWARIVLITAASFFAAVAEVANLGMIIPVVSIFTQANGSTDNWIVRVFTDATGAIGLAARTEALLFVTLLVVTVLVVIRSALVLAQGYLTAWIASDTEISLRIRLFETFLHARYTELTKRSRGSMIQDIQGPSTSIASTINLAGLCLSAAVQLTVTLGFMIYVSWWATLAVGGIAVLGSQGLRRVFRRRLLEYGRRSHKLAQSASTIMVDALDGIHVVKVHAAASRVLNRFQRFLGEQFKYMVRAAAIGRLPEFFFEILGVLLVVLLVGLSLLTPRFDLSIPALVAFIVALRRIIPAATTLNKTFFELIGNLHQIEVVDEILMRLPAEDHATDNKKVLPQINEIVLKNISFAYPERPEEGVLRDVTLALHRGEVTAIVGATGAGKTTLADLLVRLYEPEGGTIYVDGVDLRQLDLVGWRRRVGYVGQDTFLFNATLHENIATLDELISEDQVIEAARRAQIHDFVMSLPDGYNAIVGDRGLKLSGGQRQRVAIARVFLHHPEILILDEATSALDSLTEQAVHGAIGALRHKVVMVVIAHRLSTVQDADHIVVLERGRVVEQGGHTELLECRGLYWALYSGSDGDKYIAPLASDVEDEVWVGER